MITLTQPRVSFRLLVLASLGLNLFLGAMLASSWWNHRPPPSGPMPDRLVERVAPDLPEADAVRLRAAFSATRARFAALEAESREASAAVRAVALREPLDVGELRARMDAARAVRRRMGDLIEDTVLTLMPELSLPARERLAAGRR
ncbi:periplasmic heavy metal sensor [Azospirillum sp.]|uniref:periplasmic heavy metal sensor n=1 Tax=Azospirillum sp. TaxID=34012 RepID=UPI003D72C3D5